jgi:hypothetical protein
MDILASDLLVKLYVDTYTDGEVEDAKDMLYLHCDSTDMALKVNRIGSGK